MDASLDTPPFGVLAHFRPHARDLQWQRVPGGFSGASVFCGSDGETPRLALKLWPTGVTPERVRQIHVWMAHASHLPFVPQVFADLRGQSVFAEAGRVWDCCRWMPGAPRTSPSEAEVAVACAAVAQLHTAWAGESQRGPCPGLRARLHVLAENESLLLAGAEALPPVSPQLDPLLRRAFGTVARLAPSAVAALRPWENRAFLLPPCVRDLRGEHILFDGEGVSGVIDFGAMNFDSPAVDLARFLADFANPGGAIFDTALAAYRTVRPEFDAPAELIRLLSRTGVVCSVLGWLVRLAVRRERPADPSAVAQRLDVIVSRAAQFSRL